MLGGRVRDERRGRVGIQRHGAACERGYLRAHPQTAERREQRLQLRRGRAGRVARADQQHGMRPLRHRPCRSGRAGGAHGTRTCQRYPVLRYIYWLCSSPTHREKRMASRLRFFLSRRGSLPDTTTSRDHGFDPRNEQYAVIARSFGLAWTRHLTSSRLFFAYGWKGPLVRTNTRNQPPLTSS